MRDCLQERTGEGNDFLCSATVSLFKKKKPRGTQGSLRSSVGFWGRARRPDRWSVGAAVTAAEERPEPIVETNFEHLNLAARRESVAQERPRSKR